jgi:hypothetical protein
MGTDTAPIDATMDARPDGAPIDATMDARPDATPMDATSDGPDTGIIVTVDAGDGGSCVITTAVPAHSAAMATMGWGARNLAAGMLMYGCTPGMPASACLSTAPLADATNLGASASAITAGHLRILYHSTNSSSYWTRISADGRFAARGTHVHDFVRSVEVSAAGGAMYDPGFFPDNSRFMYQPNALSCPVSVLTTGTPTSIMFTEPGCSNAGSVGLYEHLGVSLGGADYWATSAGNAAWDNGGHSPTLAPPPFNETWGASARTTLTLLANTGTTFSAISTVSIPTPFQGDGVISPSSTLLMTRLADPTGHRQIGYVLYQLNASRVGTAIMQSTTEIGRYCMTGAKPAFSLDERYMVTHKYVTAEDAVELGFTGSSDPRFAAYLTQGAANVYIVDLNTGVRTRVTNMQPGQYALYPAFRSDGWMYFIVRTVGTSPEYIVASDAALVLP